MTAIELDIISANECATLTISGDVDLQTVDLIDAQGLTALEKATATLVVDLGGVTFMDSTGICALIRLRNASLEQGKQLKLAHVPERVQKLFQITGLEDVFLPTAE